MSLKDIQHASDTAQRTPRGGIALDVHLGQRVRHHDYKGQRVTGLVRGLSIDSELLLQADIVLDDPIVIPARNADDRDISIWHQRVPAHELAAFDDRDELIAELRLACEGLLSAAETGITSLGAIRAGRAAIAKVPGGAS